MYKYKYKYIYIYMMYKYIYIYTVYMYLCVWAGACKYVECFFYNHMVLTQIGQYSKGSYACLLVGKEVGNNPNKVLEYSISM